MTEREQKSRGAGGQRAAAVAAVVCALALSGSAVAQTVAVTGGTVVPISGPPIANGTVVIEGALITAVGTGVPVPAGARVFDATGKFVYPGMIDGRTVLGLQEIGSVPGGTDRNELGDFNPAIATVVAVHPHSELIPVTRVNGVTTVVSAPGGGRISGVAAIVDLDGWTPEEMARVPLGMLIVNYPRLERGGGGFGGFGGGGARLSDAEFERRAARQERELDEYFARARSYADRKARGAMPRTDRQLDAMIPVLNGEVLVGFSANAPGEIMAAVRLGRKYGVRSVILGGRRAWEVADSLVRYDVPVILGSVLSTPGRDDPFDAVYAQPGVLAEAGVRFAFSTGDAANVRNLPYHAQMAVAHGLDVDAAHRALTLGAAEILGIADQVGSIEEGKVANLFIATGDPLDVRTVVEQVFVRGRPVEMETRHTRLYERFRARPPGNR